MIKINRYVNLTAAFAMICLGQTVWAANQQVGETPSWLVIRKGQVAYTGDDGGGATTETVCRSISDMSRWMDGKKAKCFSVLPGIPVIISSSKVKEVVGLAPSYIVSIKASDGSWSGYAYTLSLLPKVPKGAQLKIYTGMANSTTGTNITKNNVPFELADGTLVELLEQVTKRQDKDFKVRVISGKYAGDIAWISSASVMLVSGGNLYWSVSAD